MNTAIRYIKSARDKSRDPAIKRNAEQTLARLNVVSGTPQNPTVSAQESPKKSLWRYCTMETQGRGLTPQGWSELAAFFVRREPWRRDKILITRDFALSDAGIEGNRADLYAEYLYLGELDSSFRFTNKLFGVNEGDHPSAGPVKVRVPYRLVFGDKYWELQGGAAIKEMDGSPNWRIDDSHPEQWVTVDAAINFLAELGNKASDKAIRQNARVSLVALKRLR